MRFAWLVGALAIAVWLWLFRAPFFLGEVCALRDSGNFYYPLFSWQCDEWAAGRFPLWNPYDGLGAPSHADATSSAFYPGKLLFALPIPFYLRFNLYLAAHVLFAAWTMYFVARRWGSSEVAAGVGAMSYAFGGYVLSQHCNVVFLISAAWLPLALWCMDIMLVRRTLNGAISFGALLAIIVYGGDPQTSYHLGLLAVLYAAVLHWHFVRTRKSESRSGKWTHLTRSLPARSDGTSRARPHSKLKLLTIAAANSFAFAAVQVLPAWEWARQSERVVSDSPRNVYEAFGYFRRQEYDRDRLDAVRAGLFESPPAETHSRRVYYYSFGPWRLLELACPNIFGKSYPVNHRWLSMLPAEGRVWSPTIYLGIIPLLAVMAAVFRSQRRPRVRWLSWCVAFSFVASFGWYGLGWIALEIQSGLKGDPQAVSGVGPQVGGLYWLLVTFLPGYAYFRYPAKWLVFATLGMSLLAAKGSDQLLNGDRKTRSILKWAGIASAVAAIPLLLFRQSLLRWLSVAPADSVYGPLDPSGAWLDVMRAVLHTATGCAFLWLLLFRKHSPNRFIAGPALIMITAIDLLVANQWLLLTVPKDLMSSRLTVLGEVQAASLGRATNGAVVPVRTIHLHHGDVDAGWRKVSSDLRLNEVVRWEREHLVHRHHLGLGIGSLDAPMTIRSAAWMEFLAAARSQPASDRNDSSMSPLTWLNVDFVISDSATKDLRDSAQPRATVVADDANARLARVQETVGTCRIVRYDPRRVEVDVEANRSAILVLTEAYDPDWSAYLLVSETEQPLDLYPIGGIVRGVPLVAGSSKVVFTYSSRSLRWGIFITIASIVLTAIVWFARTWRT